MQQPNAHGQIQASLRGLQGCCPSYLTFHHLKVSTLCVASRGLCTDGFDRDVLFLLWVSILRSLSVMTAQSYPCLRKLESDCEQECEGLQSQASLGSNLCSFLSPSLRRLTYSMGMITANFQDCDRLWQGLTGSVYPNSATTSAIFSEPPILPFHLRQTQISLSIIVLLPACYHKLCLFL